MLIHQVNARKCTFKIIESIPTNSKGLDALVPLIFIVNLITKLKKLIFVRRDKKIIII